MADEHVPDGQRSGSSAHEAGGPGETRDNAPLLVEIEKRIRWAIDDYSHPQGTYSIDDAADDILRLALVDFVERQTARDAHSGGSSSSAIGEVPNG